MASSMVLSLIAEDVPKRKRRKRTRETLKEVVGNGNPIKVELVGDETMQARAVSARRSGAGVVIATSAASADSAATA